MRQSLSLWTAGFQRPYSMEFVVIRSSREFPLNRQSSIHAAAQNVYSTCQKVSRIDDHRLEDLPNRRQSVLTNDLSVIVF